MNAADGPDRLVRALRPMQQLDGGLAVKMQRVAEVLKRPVIVEGCRAFVTEPERAEKGDLLRGRAMRFPLRRAAHTQLRPGLSGSPGGAEPLPPAERVSS